MRKVIGYKIGEANQKTMIFETVDEKTEAQKKYAKEHCKKVAEKFGIRY